MLELSIFNVLLLEKINQTFVVSARCRHNIPLNAMIASNFGSMGFQGNLSDLGGYCVSSDISERTGYRRYELLEESLGFFGP